MNTAPKSLPRIIQAAIKAISELPEAVVRGVFSCAHEATSGKKRKHRMHKQRRINLQKLFTVLVRFTDISSGKLVVPREDGLFDATLEDICRAVSVCRSSVCDMLKYLRTIGLFFTVPQIIHREAYDNGTAQFSCSCTRYLAPKFWALIGLHDEFEQEQERRRQATGVQQVKHRCCIKGVSGVHKGHELPVPAPENTAQRPKEKISSSIMEQVKKAIEQATEARKRSIIAQGD